MKESMGFALVLYVAFWLFVVWLLTGCAYVQGPCILQMGETRPGDTEAQGKAQGRRATITCQQGGHIMAFGIARTIEAINLPEVVHREDDADSRQCICLRKDY